MSFFTVLHAPWKWSHQRLSDCLSAEQADCLLSVSDRFRRHIHPCVGGWLGGLLLEAHNAHSIHGLDGPIAYIKLKPLDGVIHAAGKFVVVVVVSLACKQNVDRNQVVGCVLGLKALVANLVSPPVYKCPLESTHGEVDWQQEEHPPLRGEDHIKSRVKSHPGKARDPVMRNLFECFPFRQIARELLFDVQLVLVNRKVSIARIQHEARRVGAFHGRMRILHGIGVGMVQAVHGAVRTGTQV